MRILESARRHGIGDLDIRHALEFAIRVHDLEDDLVMFVGPTRAGDLLEVGVVTDAAEAPCVVHAMPVRSKFL